MPALKNRKHELFAQAKARGLTNQEAYSEAGYEGHNASRVSGYEEVKARQEELEADIAVLQQAELPAVTRQLLALAGAAGKLNSAAGLAVARAALMDAARLNGAVSPQTAPTPVADVPDELSEEEWLRLYAPNA